MTRLHPDDIQAIAERVVFLMQQPSLRSSRQLCSREDALAEIERLKGNSRADSASRRGARRCG